MQGYLILILTCIVLIMNVLGLCFTLYRTDHAHTHHHHAA